MPDIRINDLLYILRTTSKSGTEEKELRRFLLDRVPGIGRRFDDSVRLLEQIGVGERRANGTFATVGTDTISKELVARKLLECKPLASEFVEKCRSVGRYATKRSEIILNKSRVLRSFIWFINLLEQLGVVRRLHATNFQVVESWSKSLLCFIELGISGSFRKFSPSDYSDAIDRNLERGGQAEKFVLSFERKRLADHPFVGRIQHIALVDVGAGFDILSFHGVDDLIPNRMVEVKSWTGKKRFYLSANELRVANSHVGCYYIYLVHRDQMFDDGYIPEILEFRSRRFFDEPNRWSAVPDGWLIESTVSV